MVGRGPGMQEGMRSQGMMGGPDQVNAASPSLLPLNFDLGQPLNNALYR